MTNENSKSEMQEVSKSIKTDLPKANINFKNLFLGFGAGAIIGFIGVSLLTPSRGEETRKTFKEKSGSFLEYAPVLLAQSIETFAKYKEMYENYAVKLYEAITAAAEEVKQKRETLGQHLEQD